MKLINIFFLYILLMGCTRPDIELRHLDGYWEIDHVMFKNATKKKYAMNVTVDYFHYDDGRGYIKKVQPQLDGSFKASKDRQVFRIDSTQKGVFLNFDNGIIERISLLNKEQLIIQTQDSTSFHYKSFKPLDLELDE